MRSATGTYETHENSMPPLSGGWQTEKIFAGWLSKVPRNGHENGYFLPVDKSSDAALYVLPRECRNGQSSAHYRPPRIPVDMRAVALQPSKITPCLSDSAYGAAGCAGGLLSGALGHSFSAAEYSRLRRCHRGTGKEVG